MAAIHHASPAPDVIRIFGESTAPTRRFGWAIDMGGALNWPNVVIKDRARVSICQALSTSSVARCGLQRSKDLTTPYMRDLFFSSTACTSLFEKLTIRHQRNRRLILTWRKEHQAVTSQMLLLMCTRVLASGSMCPLDMCPD